MEFFEKVGVLTHLDLCESQPRDEGSNATPRYVQDALLLRGKQVLYWHYCKWHYYWCRRIKSRWIGGYFMKRSVIVCNG